MSVSVIIPTYKPQMYYFRECLLSLFNQTMSYNEFEIIVVLNGDLSDQYMQIVLDCITMRPVNLNVYFIKTQFLGVSNARNVGLDMALGEYICFVDDDDVVSSDYLESLCKISTPRIVGVSNVLTFDESIKHSFNDFFARRVIQQKEHHSSLFMNRAILSFPVAKLIHRDIIGNRRFDLRFKNGEDALFMTEISDKIMGFNFTEESVVYFVRKRNGSASRRYIQRKSLFYDTIRLLYAYMSLFLSMPLSYNFLLFMSRFPGVIKGAIVLYKNK